jgi:hypothetical protein
LLGGLGAHFRRKKAKGQKPKQNGITFFVEHGSGFRRRVKVQKSLSKKKGLVY